MLVRRELWEHTSLWRVPAILYVLVVLANLVLTNMFQFVQMTPDGVQSVVVTGTLGSVSSIVFIVFVFLALFYLQSLSWSKIMTQGKSYREKAYDLESRNEG